MNIIILRIIKYLGQSKIKKYKNINKIIYNKYTPELFCLFANTLNFTNCINRYTLTTLKT